MVKTGLSSVALFFYLFTVARYIISMYHIYMSKYSVKSMWINIKLFINLTYIIIPIKI